ncbi:MAG: sulfatase-like hydrolase/transferase [Akkermansiaceae bacterium]|jgi:arylsulfatase A
MLRQLVILFFVTATLAASDRPNIIVIVADDLGYGDLGLTAHPHIKTPHLDQLAKDGANFTHFYSPAQVCSPSRAATLTGRMPHRHGIYSFIGGSSGDLTHLPKTETTIPQLLRRNGYQTAIFGKWHCSLIETQIERAANGQNDIPTMDHYGFDYWFCSDDNAKVLNKPGWIRNGKTEGTKPGLAANIVGSEAVHWLTEERNPEKPFIQFVHFYEPHWYVEAPERITQRYHRSVTKNRNEAVYFASITNIDQQVGHIHQALKSLNLEENTLILFTSDHGPAKLGKANMDRNYGTAAPYRGNKYGLWDGSIHTPGIIYYPAKINAGTIINTPAGAIDWLPTICDLTETSIPEGLILDGQSLLPLLTGKPFDRLKPLQWHHYNTNFINSPNPNAVIRIGDHVICGFYSAETQLQRSSWKESHLTRVQTGKLIRFQLFNILIDPAQQTDISKVKPALFNKLKNQLIAAHKEMQSQAIGWNGTRPIIKPDR